MQLATTRENQPWICTLYYVCDDDQRIYWLSYPTRRHSQELAENSHAAVAIAIKLEQPVIGLQIEGKVSVVTDAKVVANVMRR
jgi:uncharacterized protein YhbP (UPF0306 family)